MVHKAIHEHFADCQVVLIEMMASGAFDEPSAVQLRREATCIVRFAFLRPEETNYPFDRQCPERRSNSHLIGACNAKQVEHSHPKDCRRLQADERHDARRFPRGWRQPAPGEGNDIGSERVADEAQAPYRPSPAIFSNYPVDIGGDFRRCSTAVKIHQRVQSNDIDARVVELLRQLLIDVTPPSVPRKQDHQRSQRLGARVDFQREVAEGCRPFRPHGRLPRVRDGRRWLGEVSASGKDGSRHKYESPSTKLATSRAPCRPGGEGCWGIAALARRASVCAILSLGICDFATAARAGDGAATPSPAGWTVTATGTFGWGPRYQGAAAYGLTGFPSVSWRAIGERDSFSAPDDSLDYTVATIGSFSFGPAVAFDFGRSTSDDRHLRGLQSIPWTIQPGIFAEYWTLENSVRARVEVRHGFPI